jgi:DNA-binding NarL/FixJ family response regulator
MSRIMIVDDHPVFRRGLAALLTAGGHEIVAEAANAADALSERARTDPHIVIMDLGLPDQHGVVATARLIAADPDVKVVVVTAFDDSATVNAALDAGAIGFVVKDAAADQILAAVHAAELGASMLSSGLRHPIVRDHAVSRIVTSAGLTRREEAVLILLAEGLGNVEIGSRLSLSAKTVANYVSIVLVKLGARDRVEAGRMARGVD